jgi:hypothetical protein
VKQVIILENEGNSYRYALWAAVPIALDSRCTPSPAGSARGRTLPPPRTPPSQPDRLWSAWASSWWMSASRLQRSARQLVQLQADFQAEINADNPWNRYGTYFDGTWHADGLA